MFPINIRTLTAHNVLKYTQVKSTYNHAYTYLFCVLNCVLPAQRINLAEIASTTQNVEQSWSTEYFLFFSFLFFAILIPYAAYAGRLILNSTLKL